MMRPIRSVSDEELLAAIRYLDPDLRSSEVDPEFGVFAKGLLVVSFIAILLIAANAVPILMHLLH